MKAVKVLTLIGLVVLAFGWLLSTASESIEAEAKELGLPPGIERFEDQRFEVTCWRDKAKGGLSCLPNDSFTEKQ